MADDKRIQRTLEEQNKLLRQTRDAERERANATRRLNESTERTRRALQESQEEALRQANAEARRREEADAEVRRFQQKQLSTERERLRLEKDRRRRERPATPEMLRQWPFPQTPGVALTVGQFEDWQEQQHALERDARERAHEARRAAEAAAEAERRARPATDVEKLSVGLPLDRWADLGTILDMRGQLEAWRTRHQTALPPALAAEAAARRAITAWRRYQLLVALAFVGTTVGVAFSMHVLWVPLALSITSYPGKERWRWHWRVLLLAGFYAGFTYHDLRGPGMPPLFPTTADRVFTAGLFMGLAALILAVRVWVQRPRENLVAILHDRIAKREAIEQDRAKAEDYVRRARAQVAAHTARYGGDTLNGEPVAPTAPGQATRELVFLDPHAPPEDARANVLPGFDFQAAVADALAMAPPAAPSVPNDASDDATTPGGRFRRLR